MFLLLWTEFSLKKKMLFELLFSNYLIKNLSYLLLGLVIVSWLFRKKIFARHLFFINFNFIQYIINVGIMCIKMMISYKYKNILMVITL